MPTPLRRSVVRTVPTRGPRAVLLLALAAGVLPAACATRAPTPAGSLSGGAAAASPARDLERLLAAQARSGRTPEALPVALDLPALRPLNPVPPEAMLPLERVLGEMAEAAAPVGEGNEGGEGIDPETADAALRHYVAGRVELEAGRLAGAIEQLQMGVRLDPTSARLWEALGEAQQRSGLARPALESLARAAELGSRDPGTLLALARAAQAQGDHARAASLLARLAAGDATENDAALGMVVYASLGQSLIAHGRLGAGVEALGRGLDLPPAFAQPTPFYEEVGDLLRRRSDLWRLAGDTLCRLGSYEEALAAYEQAAAFPSLDPASVLPRRIYASLRLGRPAGAGLAIHEELARPDGPQRLEPRHLALIRELAAYDARTGAALSAAIMAERDLRLPALADSLSGRLVRAAAAGLPPGEAAALLASRLADNPLDAATLAELLALTPEGDAAGAARALAGLAERAPLHADTIAQTVTRPEIAARAGESASPRTLITALEARPARSRSVGGRLLLAGLHSRAGDPKAAGEILETLVRERPGDLAVTAMAVTVGARLGRWDLAGPALERIESGAATPPAVLARALAAVQRLGPALEALDRALESAEHAPRPADLLLGADVAATLGRHVAQERYLLGAVELDPYNEAAYVPLLRLYLPDTGALADRQKLTDAVRKLREAAPSGRTLRLLRAEEFMTTGRLLHGQRELLGLAEEDPFDPAPFQTLISVWLHPRLDDAGLRRGFVPPATQALDALIGASPEADWPAAARAVLAAIDGDAGTLERLAGGRSPTEDPPEVAAAIEGALRRAGRGAEADERAAARLAAAPPSIDNTVEYAALLLRRGEVELAADVLHERLPAGVTLTSQQTGPLLQAIEGATRVAPGGGEGGRASVPPATALRVLDRAVELVSSAPATLHALRIAYILAMPDPDVDALVDAAALAAAQHPDDAEVFYQTAAARLGRDEPVLALDFLTLAVMRAEAPTPELYRLWVLSAVGVGQPGDAVAAVRAAVEAGMTPFILPPEPDEPPEEGPPTPAELAYRLGVILTSSGEEREPVAIALYELALEHEPEHAWACNNLGYTLLEREGPTERAAALLETAYRLLPAQASVVDSIGWLRYKQGVIDDVADEEGSVVKEGAVTLLSRAVNLSNRNNPTLFDHLGDAAWMQGQREMAIDQWRIAESLARQQAQAIRRAGLPDSAELRAYRTRLITLARGAAAKQAAAVRRQAPAVAPIPGLEVPILEPDAAPRRAEPRGDEQEA